jgi:hypothetical protein
MTRCVCPSLAPAEPVPSHARTIYMDLPALTQTHNINKTHKHTHTQPNVHIYNTLDIIYI